MEPPKKQRLVGIMVVIALAIIFLPSLFHREQRVVVDTTSLIPPQPIVAPIVAVSPVRPDGIEPVVKPRDVFQPALQEDNAPVTKPRLNEKGVPDAWVVQVGSFKSEKLAQELKDKLLADKHRAYARPVETTKGKFFRVFIGPHIDKRQAITVKAAVDKQYQLSSQIVRFSAR